MPAHDDERSPPNEWPGRGARPTHPASAVGRPDAGALGTSGGREGPNAAPRTPTEALRGHHDDILSEIRKQTDAHPDALTAARDRTRLVCAVAATLYGALRTYVRGSLAHHTTPRTSVIDQQRRVVVGETFVGPEVGEMLHPATIAIVGEVPVDVLWHAVPAFPECERGVRLRLLEADRGL